MAEWRVLLLAHGSNEPRWRKPFEELAAGLKGELPGIRLAYLEFSPPTIFDVAAEASREGVEGIRILPIFFAAGNHLEGQIGDQLALVKARFPKILVEVFPPVGEDPRTISLLREMAKEAARSPFHRGPEGKP